MRKELLRSRGYDPYIAGDELSLKIASYPATARYLSARLKGSGDTVCELCCGIGVSLIELSGVYAKVIGVDNSPTVLDDCAKNLKHFGLTNCQLICGDVSSRELLATIQADIVLYDIPYWSSHSGQVDPDKQNPDLQKLISNIRELISEKIVIYTPPHMTFEEITGMLGSCEFLEVYINGEHDRNFVFLGELINHTGKTQINL